MQWFRTLPLMSSRRLGQGGGREAEGWPGMGGEVAAMSHRYIIHRVVAAANRPSGRRPAPEAPLESMPGHKAGFLLKVSWGGTDLVLSKKEDPPSIRDLIFKAVRSQAGAQTGRTLVSGFRPSLGSNARSTPFRSSAATNSTNTSCAPTTCQTRTLD